MNYFLVLQYKTNQLLSAKGNKKVSYNFADFKYSLWANFMMYNGDPIASISHQAAEPKKTPVSMMLSHPIRLHPLKPIAPERSL